MTLENDAIALHRILKGKIGIQSRVTANFGRPPFMTETGGERFQGMKDTSTEASKLQQYGVLDLIYTPGVAAVAQAVSRNKELACDYTSKWNNVAIVCDGTRVLGLGNIEPEGALPVMEGKSALFKLLGDIYAYPLLFNFMLRGNDK